MPETGGVCGRRRELGVMAAFLDGLRSGPSGLLLEGEAGIGKTTVWRAGVADAAARSCLVLSSRPAEAEAKLSFAALADLLGGVLERVLVALPGAPAECFAGGVAAEGSGGQPAGSRGCLCCFPRGDSLPGSSRPGTYRG